METELYRLDSLHALTSFHMVHDNLPAQTQPLSRPPKSFRGRLHPPSELLGPTSDDEIFGREHVPQARAMQKHLREIWVGPVVCRGGVVPTGYRERRIRLSARFETGASR